MIFKSWSRSRSQQVPRGVTHRIRKEDTYSSNQRTPQKSAVQIQQLHHVISESANQLLAHSLQQLDNDEHQYAMAWLRYQEQQVAHKCKCCSAAFPSKNRLHSHIRESHIKTIPSKNRLHSHIRECHIKTTTLSSSSTAAPHTRSVTLVSASGKPSNQAKTAVKQSECTPKSAYIPLDPHESPSRLNDDESITPVATAATAKNETSTSSHAAKETASASRSQIASKPTANPLIPMETPTSPPLKHQAISSSESLSASPLPAYRAISPPPPEYQAKSQNYLTIDDLHARYTPLEYIRSPRSHLTVQDLYTRYAPLKHARSSHLTIQDLYMRYAPLNSAKSSSSTRLTPRTLPIMTIKDLYKRIEKSAEKIAPGTPKCTQHSLGS